LYGAYEKKMEESGVAEPSVVFSIRKSDFSKLDAVLRAVDFIPRNIPTEDFSQHFLEVGDSKELWTKNTVQGLLDRGFALDTDNHCRRGG